jgi:high-affinity iron transporter
VLEAAIITAILLSYLRRIGKYRLSRYVWYGVYLAVVTSLVLGAFIWFAYGALPETLQLLFEAMAAYLAVAVLTSMIYWMAIKGRYIKRKMERGIEAIVTRGEILGLVSTSFIVVFREGLETVLFLTPFLLDDTVGTLAGLAIGTASAIILSYGIFIAGVKINLRRFFYFTSILLVLLAGGLAGYGTHELLEYCEEKGVGLGWFAKPAYALNIEKESPFHHKGVIGSIFAVILGYTVKAEWGRLIVHLVYLGIALPLVIWVYRKRE